MNFSGEFILQLSASVCKEVLCLLLDNEVSIVVLEIRFASTNIMLSEYEH